MLKCVCLSPGQRRIQSRQQKILLLFVQATHNILKSKKIDSLIFTKIGMAPKNDFFIPSKYTQPNTSLDFGYFNFFIFYLPYYFLVLIYFLWSMVQFEYSVTKQLTKSIIITLTFLQELLIQYNTKIPPSSACQKTMHNNPNKKYETAATSGQHPLIDKIIIMHNCQTKAINQFKIKVEYVTATREINISRVLQQIHSQGLKIQNSQIFFQNTEIKTYMYLGTFPFEHTVYLKHQYCFDSFIKIRYKKITDSPKNSNNTQINKLKNDQGFKQINQPKEANKHRTIGQVVEIVKNWKKLSTQVDHTGHKIHTLTSAAEVIGICKKTLQDYAYQVQFGHEFNFDFEKNINQKIGVLRKFVKNKKKQIAFLNNTDNYWSFDGNSNSDQDLQSGTGR